MEQKIVTIEVEVLTKVEIIDDRTEKQFIKVLKYGFDTIIISGMVFSLIGMMNFLNVVASGIMHDIYSTFMVLIVVGAFALAIAGGLIGACHYICDRRASALLR